MAQDLKLTENRDIEIDPTGDYATVSERTNIRQQFANAIFRAWGELEITLLNANAEEDFRSQIVSELDNLPYADTFEVEVESDPSTGLEATIVANALDNPVTEEVEV